MEWSNNNRDHTFEEITALDDETFDFTTINMMESDSRCGSILSEEYCRHLIDALVVSVEDAKAASSKPTPNYSEAEIMEVCKDTIRK